MLYISSTIEASGVLLFLAIQSWTQPLSAGSQDQFFSVFIAFSLLFLTFSSLFGTLLICYFPFPIWLTPSSFRRKQKERQPLGHLCSLPLCFLFPGSSKFSEAHQSLSLLIPQTQKHRLQARTNSQCVHVLKFGCFIKNLPQAVIRNPLVQMVNMMIPDIPRKPLQDFRQLKKRTSL